MNYIFLFTYMLFFTVYYYTLSHRYLICIQTTIVNLHILIGILQFNSFLINYTILYNINRAYPPCTIMSKNYHIIELYSVYNNHGVFVYEFGSALHFYTHNFGSPIKCLDVLFWILIYTYTNTSDKAWQFESKTIKINPVGTSWLVTFTNEEQHEN